MNGLIEEKLVYLQGMDRGDLVHEPASQAAIDDIVEGGGGFLSGNDHAFTRSRWMKGDDGT